MSLPLEELTKRSREILASIPATVPKPDKHKLVADYVKSIADLITVALKEKHVPWETIVEQLNAGQLEDFKISAKSLQYYYSLCHKKKSKTKSKSQPIVKPVNDGKEEPIKLPDLTPTPSPEAKPATTTSDQAHEVSQPEQQQQHEPEPELKKGFWSF